MVNKKEDVHYRWSRVRWCQKSRSEAVLDFEKETVSSWLAGTIWFTSALSSDSNSAVEELFCTGDTGLVLDLVMPNSNVLPSFIWDGVYEARLLLPVGVNRETLVYKHKLGLEHELPVRNLFCNEDVLEDNLPLAVLSLMMSSSSSNGYSNVVEMDSWNWIDSYAKSESNTELVRTKRKWTNEAIYNTIDC